MAGKVGIQITKLFPPKLSVQIISYFWIDWNHVCLPFFILSQLIIRGFRFNCWAAKLFFDKVRRLPSQFVFPFLDEVDFVGSNWDKNFMTVEQTTIVHRAIAKYNRSLGRIAEAIDIRSFSSHSARHTYAKQLKDMDFSYEQIQHSLNHASLKSTKEYIDTRFDNGVAKDVAKARYQKRRSL